MQQDETLHQKATDEMERIRSRVTDLEEQLCKCHQLNQQLLSLDNTSLQSNDESHNMTLVAREQELQLLLDRAQGDADSLRVRSLHKWPGFPLSTGIVLRAQMEIKLRKIIWNIILVFPTADQGSHCSKLQQWHFELFLVIYRENDLKQNFSFSDS